MREFNQYLEDPQYADKETGKVPGALNILFIYKTNSRISAGTDEDVKTTLDEIGNQIKGWKDKAELVHDKLKEVFSEQYERLDQIKDTKLAIYDEKILEKGNEYKKKSEEVSIQHSEITNLQSGIGNINSLKNQIGNKVSSLKKLFDKNGAIVEDWKSLFRNQSQYFLDEAEVTIYQDLFGDWKRLLNHDFIPFLTLIQQGEQSNIPDLYRTVEEYAEELQGNINWVIDRSELVDKLGSANNDKFQQVINDLKSTDSETIPFVNFAANLQVIKDKRGDLLTSYDDLKSQIVQVDQWLGNAKVYLTENQKNSLLSRYIEQLEFTRERLSVAPFTVDRVKQVKTQFNKEITELKTAWNDIKTTLSELVNTANEKNNKDDQLKEKKDKLIDQEGDLGKYEQEKDNLSQKLNGRDGLNSEINSKTLELSQLELQQPDLEVEIKQLTADVGFWKGQVDYYRNKEGGFFKWSDDADGYVRRTTRIQNYKDALENLANKRQLLQTKKYESASLTQQINTITSYLSNLKTEKTETADGLESVNKNIRGVETDIFNTKTAISNLESDLTNLDNEFKISTSTFAEKRADIQQQFSDIDLELSEQENLGDKLISLGLLISEQDITFFKDIIYDPENPNNTVAKLFRDAIDGGDEQIDGLNPVLQALKNYVGGQNGSGTNAQTYLDNFAKILVDQKTEITDWLNQEHPDLLDSFDEKLEQAKDALNDIQLGQRLPTLIQQGNLAEVIEAVTDRITITEFINLVTSNDAANLDSILKLKEIVHQEVFDDITAQNDILQEVNEGNIRIQSDLDSLNNIAQQLFQAFDGLLPQALGKYLNAQDTLDLRQDIQAIIDDRLDAIADSNTVVNDAINTFEDKIAAAKSLEEKTAAIKQELEFSDQAFALADAKATLNKVGLTTVRLTTGISQLSDFIQNLIDNGQLDSATVQKLETAKQNIGQLCDF